MISVGTMYDFVTSENKCIKCEVCLYLYNLSFLLLAIVFKTIHILLFYLTVYNSGFVA